MYIDINTLFAFEVSKSDDQSILAAIVCTPLFTSLERYFCDFLAV
jgi:thiamine transporter ThiT